MKDPKNKNVRRCNCGARKCRGYLWDDGEQNGQDSDESDQESEESDQEG